MNRHEFRGHLPGSRGHQLAQAGGGRRRATARALARLVAMRRTQRASRVVGLRRGWRFDARSRCAELFGAVRSEDVVFVRGCTEALNLVLKGWLKHGDHVVPFHP